MLRSLSPLPVCFNTVYSLALHVQTVRDLGVMACGIADWVRTATTARVTECAHVARTRLGLVPQRDARPWCVRGSHWTSCSSVTYQTARLRAPLTPLSQPGQAGSHCTAVCSLHSKFFVLFHFHFEERNFWSDCGVNSTGFWDGEAEEEQ